MKSRDRFFRDSIDVSLPLLLWALHFFGVYVFVALACGSSLADAQLLAYPLIKSVSVLMSVLAISLVAGLCWRACVIFQRNSGTLLSLARLVCAMLAILGIVWTTIPMFMLSSCQN